MSAKKKTDTTDNTIRMAFKYRLYPTDEQKHKMAINFGCCRYVYNHFRYEREAAWEKTQPTLKKPVIVPGTEKDKKPEYVKDDNDKIVYEEVINEGYDPNAKNMTLFDTSRLLTTLKKETVDENGHKWLLNKK